MQEKRVKGDSEDDMILLELEIEYTFFFFEKKNNVYGRKYLNNWKA